MSPIEPSPSVAAPLAAPRVVPNSWHALGGIWRLTRRRYTSPKYWLGLVAGLAILAVLAVASLETSGSETSSVRNFGWFAYFYLRLLVPLIAFISAAATMRDDLKPDSVDYVLMRPVRRPVWVLGRFLARLVCSQFDFLLAFAVVMGVSVYRDIPDFVAEAPRLLLGQVLLIIAASGFGFLCGVLSSRYIILGLFYGAIVELGVGSIPTQLNQLSMSQHVLSMLSHLLGSPGVAATLPATTPWGATAILVSFAIATLAITVLVFSTREFAGGNSRD